jgi:hypothetical protein
MNEIHANAGQRVRVVRRAFSSVPVDYRFSARAAIPGEKLGGIVEVRRSRWILPGAPATAPLQSSNVVAAGSWNTFMSVDVVPDVDAVITTEGRAIRNLRPILVVALLVIALAAAMIVAML